MRNLTVLSLLCLWVAHPVSAIATEPAGTDDQIIVFMRHGEKPQNGLGQLSCRGLNRSLALPVVLTRLFGKPDRIVAADPSHLKDDDGETYAYVRPLATIEPTAIRNGLPVETTIGYDDVDALVKTLTPAKHEKHVIFVAWEHKKLVKAAKSLMKAAGGDPDDIPKWSGSDFDGLYVLRFRVNGEPPQFEHLRQGLDGLPETCP